MLFCCGRGHRCSVARPFPQLVNDGKTKRNQAEHKGSSSIPTPPDKFKNESREQKKDANANRIPTSPPPGKEAKCAQEHDHGDNPRHNYRSNGFAIIAASAITTRQGCRAVTVVGALPGARGDVIGSKKCRCGARGSNDLAVNVGMRTRNHHGVHQHAGLGNHLASRRHRGLHRADVAGQRAKGFAAERHGQPQFQ